MAEQLVRDRKRKKLRSVFLDEEQLVQLTKLSAKTRVPQSVYIREGISFILDKYRTLIPSNTAMA